MSYDRILPLVNKENVIVVTNEAYARWWLSNCPA